MMKARKYGVWIFMTLSIVALSGCMSSPAPQPGTTNFPVSKLGNKIPISMKNSTFTPSTTTIKVGTTIVWTNDDSTQHSVYASGAFDDIILQPGETFSYTFKTAGSFNYVSTLQKNMIGKIIVE